MKDNKQQFILKGSVSLVEETSRIVEVANKLGIVLPSTHTALFKTIYAKIEEPNGNGVRLAKDAVESSLQGLVGSQVNLEHLGLGFIVGIILDAWLNAEQEIEVIFTFAKNIYKEDYVRALEKMQEGKLAVSFELMSERESQEHLSDGTVRLHDIDWQGMGFLIDADPAYKKARVYEMAKVYKQRADESVQELVYASKISKSCDDVIKAGQESETKEEFTKPDIQAKEEKTETNQGGAKVMKEEQKKLVAQLRAELEGHLPENISDDDLLVEAKVEEIRKAKADAEAKAKEDADAKAKAEQEAQAQKEVVDAKIKELETLVEAQKKELETLKAENEVFKAEAKEREAKAKADKIASIKAEMKDNQFCKEFSDEDYLNEAKVKEAKILQENADLKAENADLKKGKKQKVEASKENELPTGSSETKSEDNVRVIIAKMGKS